MSGGVPPALRAHSILATRVPDLEWSVTRVVQAATDHADLDVVAIAEACADYAATHRRVKDGPRLFRTFLENASRTPSIPPDPSDRLKAYDRRRNR